MAQFEKKNQILNYIQMAIRALILLPFEYLVGQFVEKKV